MEESVFNAKSEASAELIRKIFFMIHKEEHNKEINLCLSLSL